MFLTGLSGTALADHNCNGTAAGDCMSRPFGVPTTLAEYKKLRAKWSNDPWHGAMLFVAAMLARQLNEKEGNAMAVMSVDRASGLGSGNWYKGYALRRSDLAYYKAYCTRALVQGTSNKKGYAFNPNKVVLKFRVQAKARFTGTIAKGRYKVFVWSMGASTAQPIWMKRDSKGRWKAQNYSSIKANCQKPLVKWNAKAPSKAPKFKNPDDDL